MANNFERRSCRSDKFQFLWGECQVSGEMMESFPNEDSISGRLSGGFAYDERILALEDQLKEEFWRIVETLTERQRDVLRLYAEGFTQQEIAKQLGVNQSSVAKNISGNTSYYKNASGEVVGKTNYGGSKKRLGKIIETDKKIGEILQLIAELRSEKW